MDLALGLGNISKASQLSGVSRDIIYRPEAVSVDTSKSFGNYTTTLKFFVRTPFSRASAFQSLFNPISDILLSGVTLTKLTLMWALFHFETIGH